MINKSPTFCVLPFLSIATAPSGNLRVCCNSIHGKNLILKPDGSPYKIDKDDLKQAWNSPSYKKIRTQMLSGKKPEICQPCFMEEEAGIKSARITYNQKYQSYKTSLDSQIKNQIKYLDLRLGNKCNLRCRMCSPYSSSSLVKEWNKLPQSSILPSFTTDKQKQLKDLSSWPENIDFNKLIEDIEAVEEIYLTGGEPLLIKKQYTLLKTLIRKDLAKNISLKYNTNLTKCDETLFELWKEFKQVFLSLSIDAFGKLNDYIRYPSRWNQLEKNIDQVMNHKKRSKNLKIKIDCTVQMYNITKMKPFLSWVKKHKISLYFNILNTPSFLNIRTLPQTLKQKAEEDLYLFEDDFDVTKPINYMNQEHWTHHLKNFFEYTDLLDQSRNQTLDKILPEFSPFRIN